MTMEQPRYMQILSVLSQRVETGQYPLEERLPTESELCDEFGASRFTVREALRRLVDHGMVQRRQGAGSIVVAASPQGALRAFAVIARRSVAVCPRYSL